MIRNTQSKHLSRRELEELKRKRDEVETAEVFGEFMAAFDDDPTKRASKSWVRAGTFDAGSRREDHKDRGKLYRPEIKREIVVKREPQEPVEDKPERPRKKQEKEKKKSNLELFKEELQKIQEERQERYKLKSRLPSDAKIADFPSDKPEKAVKMEAVPEMRTSLLSLDAVAASAGSFDNGDPSTTNLYLGNLHPKVSEQQLVEVFGKYGPLASVKIMWPRTDEERQRGKNCGFVAFMTRKDAERAMKAVSGTELLGFEMKLGWGKSVPKPIQPVYVPPQLLELTMPPPPSGLPFNAQPSSKDKEWLSQIGFKGEIPSDLAVKKEFKKVLERSIVKVVIPTERQLLHLIHRMVEFVVREGPMFEAMVMNKELGNPAYRFLFDNKSPAHVYYRWKLFSVLHGESVKDWSTKEFRMYKGGSVWRPPPVNPFSHGMPDELISDDEVSEKETAEEEGRKSPESRKTERRTESKSIKRGSLSNSQRDRFEDMLRGLTPEKRIISEAMVFCIEHAEAASEICECISESLCILETPISKKIARLYLVSDILHNCAAKVTNASYYRKGFQEQWEMVCKSLHDKYENLESRMKAEAFKARVMRVFRAWEDWALYPTEFLIKMQNIFLGLATDSKGDLGDLWSKHTGVDVDGEPISDNEIDGMPLGGGVAEDIDGIPLTTSILKRPLSAVDSSDDDVDGIPMTLTSTPPLPPLPPPTKKPAPLSTAALPGFKPSKWETVDPDDVADQAMTTSKWDLLDQEQEQDQLMAAGPSGLVANKARVSLVAYDDDVDGTPLDGSPIDSKSNSPKMQDDPIMDERRRAQLREVEIKVMEFADDLESGQRQVKLGMTLDEQVQAYRRKLLKKMDRDLRRGGSTSDRRSKRARSSDSESEREDYRNIGSSRKKHRTKSRSRSPHHRRSSHHPRRRSRSGSRSRSPYSAAASSSSRHHKHRSSRR